MTIFEDAPLMTIFEDRQRSLILATGDHPDTKPKVFAAGPETYPEYSKQYSRRLLNSILASGDHSGSISEVFAAGPETSPEYIHQYNRRLRTGDHPG